MNSSNTFTPIKLPDVRRSLAFEAGNGLWRTGGEGFAWRVRQGLVRLDSTTSTGHSVFASLAIAGDIVGCETLLFGVYTFNATALTQCELSPWPEGDASAVGESLLQSLATAQRRAADIVALRGGQAVDRVLGLVRLLADGAGKVVLPARQDMADITDLRFETISRIIKGLERAGVLAAVHIDGVRAARGYRVDLAAMAAG